jgi:hypothetical protein
MTLAAADARTEHADVTPFEIEVVETFRAFLAAQAAAEKALMARDRIIDEAHRRHGISVRMLSPYLRDILVRGELTSDEIEAAAISEGNVRYALREKRWESEA